MGMSVKAIAKEAALSRMTIRRIVGHGCGGCTKTRRLNPEVASRILAVRLPRLPADTEGRTWKQRQADETVGVLPEGFVGSLRSLTWQRHGNCADDAIPTRTFFPSRGDRVLLDAAKAVCEGCPVKQQCLEYGIATGSSGLWGGLSELDRQKLQGLRANHDRGGTSGISSATA
jgi:WhiB family redox-sensing transcriptional regulator